MIKQPQAKHKEYQILENHVQKILVQTTKVQFQQVITFFGAPGSGISTLLSLLMGANLNYKKGRGGSWQINHTGNSSKYPQIRNQAQNSPKQLAIYSSQGKYFIETGQQFCTYTPNHELTNAFENCSLYKKGKKLKIVLVIQQSSIVANRGGVLVEIVNKLAQIFQQDVRNMMKSIILVISKANVLDWDVQSLNDQLSSILSQNMNLRQQSKLLLEFLTKNNKFFFFPRPDQLSDYIEKIKKEISYMPYYQLSKNHKPLISVDAKDLVQKLAEILNNQLNEMNTRLVEQSKLSFSKKVTKSKKQVDDYLSCLLNTEYILSRLNKQMLSQSQLQKSIHSVGGYLGISVEMIKEFYRDGIMVFFLNLISQNAPLRNTLIFPIYQLVIQMISQIDDTKLKKIMQSRQNELKKQQLVSKANTRLQQQPNYPKSQSFQGQNFRNTQSKRPTNGYKQTKIYSTRQEVPPKNFRFQQNIKSANIIQQRKTEQRINPKRLQSQEQNKWIQQQSRQIKDLKPKDNFREMLYQDKKFLQNSREIVSYAQKQRSMPSWQNPESQSNIISKQAMQGNKFFEIIQNHYKAIQKQNQTHNARIQNMQRQHLKQMRTIHEKNNQVVEQMSMVLAAALNKLSENQRRGR